MENEAIQQAAEILTQLRTRTGGLGAPLADLPHDVRPSSLEDAYAIQEALRRLLSHLLGPVAGWKIGCTTRIMQAYLGIDHPCAGTLFSKQVFEGHVQLHASNYFKLGLECELAVQLTKPLGPDEDPAKAVDSVMVSVEIVDERFVDFSKCAKETLIADDFFSAGCVIAEPVSLQSLANGDDLGGLRGGFVIDGQQAAQGYGSAILGDPIAALAWLADHRRGEGGLQAGEIVTLGSVIKTIYPQAGTHITAGFDGLGTVSVDVI
ncbi:MAG: fumarylacetoacetate hydrolase family protein [Pseudomonadota bacterium]